MYVQRAAFSRCMLEATDSQHAPWYIVRSDDKKRARLNCISH
jgi:polyphosphate kinase